MLNHKDWSRFTTHEQSKHLLVLDNDLASVEITLVDFEKLKSDPQPVAGHDPMTVAQDCAKRFAAAVTRTWKLLTLIQDHPQFASASPQIRELLAASESMLKRYRQARNKIEHSDQKMIQFPAVATSTLHQDTVTFPIGTAVRVTREPLEMFLAVRSAILRQLESDAREGRSHPPDWEKRGKAHVYCFRCLERYELPFMMQPGHDDDALCAAFLDTACPHCGATPADFDIRGFGPPGAP